MEEQQDAFPIKERKDKMRLVALADITVGERFRKDFGDMEEFVSSIFEKGIIQPITVDSNLNLLAGGRRFEGATRAGLKKIPCIIRDFVDNVDSREIELMENVYRKDFTWDEEAKIIREIDELYKKNDRKWSGRKTAELLDKSVANVARNLQLAKAIEFFPELGKAKTADDALKTLKNMEIKALTEELRERQKDRISAPTEYEGSDAQKNLQEMFKGIKAILKVADENYQISDCFAGMSKLRTNGHIDFIECDPPYGIDLNMQKGNKDSASSTVTNYEEVSAEHYPSFLKKLCEEMFRVAAKDCWLVFWYGPTWHSEILTSLKNAGWLVDPIPAIWTKTLGQTLQPELYLARSYEPFFIARKGKPIIAKRGRLNNFSFPGVHGIKADAKYHPTQRPVNLIQEILNTFLVGTQHVLVPFAGSGATLRACYSQGHKVIGFDLDKQYKSMFMLKVESDTLALRDNPDAPLM